MSLTRMAMWAMPFMPLDMLGFVGDLGAGLLLPAGAGDGLGTGSGAGGGGGLRDQVHRGGGAVEHCGRGGCALAGEREEALVTI
jgi:hypothetical protein